MMGVASTIARRTFLVGSLAVAGGVAFGFYKYKTPYPNPLLDELSEDEAALTPYVLIGPEDITLITPRGEMGQGVQTTLAALLAEELDIEWTDIKISHGPASKTYYNKAVIEEGLPISTLDDSPRARFMREKIVPIIGKFMALHITGGSSAMADGYEKMRVAGATARETLKQAAARQLGLKVSDLTTHNGHVIAPDGQKLSYHVLARQAAREKLPREVSLKSPSEWRFLGHSMPRLDMLEKVTGTAVFAADIRLPGMKFASIRANPHLGGRLKSYNPAEAKTIRGLEKIVPLENGIIAIADTSWGAMQAVQKIECDWGKAAYPDEMNAHFDQVAQAFHKPKYDSRLRNDGDVETALEGADILEAEYRVPYLAHACMEPLNATAWLREGQLDIWVGTQAPVDVLKTAQAQTGLDEKKIRIHCLYMGGGFGRKSEVDYVYHAIEAAKAIEGTPVHLIWSREEDMTHDFYRPIAIGRLRASIRDGRPDAFDLKVACPSLLASGAERGGPSLPGGDITSAQTLWDQPYDIPNYRTTAYKAESLLPLGAWRSVGSTQNAFFQESMIDEVAHKAGRDPMDMRLELMNNNVCRKVLETVAKMSNWGSSLEPNHARGVAFCLSFGVPAAEVLEIKQTSSGIKVIKAYAAVDVGTALDPRNIEAQVFGGLYFGLTAAIMGEISVERGAVIQSNFHNYDGLRMYQAPEPQIKILENGHHIRGIGEPGTPPAAPALGNAIFALTGQRLRELPFRKFIQFA